MYGFGSLLAIGVGATLGSPLFVLIPENIIQYEFVSPGALVIATVLSVFVAKVYGDMYIKTRGNAGLRLWVDPPLQSLRMARGV